MQVEEMMTRHVVSVAPEESAATAARTLSRHNVGCLPVCTQDGRLCGVVTDRDIVLRCVAAGADPEKTPVRAIMTSRVVAVAPDDDARDVQELMSREQVRRIPVASGGKVVGMVSLADLALRRSSAMEASACLCEICNNVKNR